MLKYSQQRSLGNINWAIIEGNWNNSDDLNATFSGYMTQGCFKRSKYESSCTFYDGWTTIDGTATHIDSGATAALYRYTPHFSGNRNFDTIFNNWFGSVHANYVPLDTPRWMVVPTDTTRVNPSTGLAVGATITAGTQLQLVDKIAVEGVWYLRTAADSQSRLNQGIPISKVTEIQPVAFDTPRYMQLNSIRNKWNPLTGFVDHSATYSSGTQFDFADKILVNGNWFFRSEEDKAAGKSLYVTATAAGEIPYLSLETPRFMQVSRDTHKLSPTTGAVDSAVPADTQVKFDTKILVGGKWYFRATEDTTSGAALAIPSSDVREVPYQNLGPAPIWMQFSQSTLSYLPATQAAVAGTNVDASQHSQILLSQKITINGTVYYRTAWNETHNQNLAIPASYFTPIPFASLDTPRTLSLAAPTQKVNPLTGEKVDGVLPAGYQLPYATKIFVNGQWYLRTQNDTQNDLTKGIPLNKLAI
jgi:hypothetical protein